MRNFNANSAANNGWFVKKNDGSQQVYVIGLTYNHDSGSDGESSWATQICNRVSINMTPFKMIRMNIDILFYRGTNWSPADVELYFYKSNHTTLIRKSTERHRITSTDTVVFDVTNINEQAYFRTIFNSVYGSAYGTNGYAAEIHSIEFLT